MNKNMVIVMHDAFQGASQWTSFATSLNAQRTFGVDSHLCQLFDDADKTLTQAQHITKACGWASNLNTANVIMPTYVVEWSAATYICVNPEGSTRAGTYFSIQFRGANAKA
jgi:glucan 1,3-beta-glucosidase